MTTKRAENNHGDPTIPWSRRKVVASLGLGGLAWSLSGCPAPSPRVLPQCSLAKPPTHTRIDAHVHIFNGTDLQIAGYLTTSVANEYPSLKGLIGLIAGPLQSFVWAFSPQAGKELHHLNEVRARSDSHTLSTFMDTPGAQADREETDGQYNEFLRQQFQRVEVRAELSRLLLVSTQSRATALAVSPSTFTAPVNGESARLLANQFDEQSGIPFFDYLQPFFSYRYVNFFELIEQFTCANNSDIDTFIAHLIDYDQPLGGSSTAVTPSSIRDQTAVVSEICQLAKGRLLALAPYCPLKDVARHGESLANVLDAWSKPGFVGAKMYPPMGFYPYGNSADVDAALARLYHECVTRDAVVMAHAGSSLCVSSGACEYPGPVGWGKALDHTFAVEKKPLRASFGHFGGPFGTGPNSLDWPMKFIELMQAPSGQNAYADLAYASDVLDSSNDSRLTATLSKLLTARSSPLSHRLMYGSDWIMLGLESKWRNYAVRMTTLITTVERSTALSGFSDRFFGGNARQWLALTVPGSLASINTKRL